MHAPDPTPPEPATVHCGTITDEQAREEVVDLVMKFLAQRWATYLASREPALNGMSLFKLEAARTDLVKALEQHRLDGAPQNRHQRRAARKKARRK